MIDGILLLAAAALSTLGPAVAVRGGNLIYTTADGSRTITHDGATGDSVLAPDGRTIAFVKTEGTSGDGTELSSLWVADGLTGRVRKLLAPRPDPDPKRNLTGFEKPKFSLDGGYVYVNSDAWATSSAVHQVALANGKERFVIDGGLTGVLRTGPYRGFLLVARHRYRKAPAMGSYNPVYVVRPDAGQAFIVPGSDRDDGERSVAAWLQAKRWRAE